MGSEDLEDTKLHEAVRYGDVDDVKKALKQGDNPNQIGIYQWNALHEASSNGDLAIVKILLKHAGDPNKPDKLRGCTPVHYAARNGFPDLLKNLLEAGGLYDIRNNEDETCLDVAEDFDCQKLLRQQRDKLVISQNAPRIVIEETVLSDTKRHDTNNNNDIHIDVTSLSSDLDSISIATNSSTESRPHSRAWGPERVLGVKKEQGYIQLSFEYNAKKETFKVRVWQLADILLPPPDTTMINTIYVKSYLQPDSARHSKRKTEEVRVEKSDLKEIKKKGQDRIVNFQPGCFRFTRAFEYEKVSRTIVESKIVDIQVCITQRYTRKSFVVATYNLPMKIACKKLVKEKYPLKPCISTTLPENMKVYSAGELSLTSSRGYSHSNPSLSRMSSGSSGSWATPYRDRTGSEYDLRSVISTDSGTSSKPCIEIDVPDEEDEELQQALTQIRIMEAAERGANQHTNIRSRASDPLSVSSSKSGPSLSQSSREKVKNRTELSKPVFTGVDGLDFVDDRSNRKGTANRESAYGASPHTEVQFLGDFEDEDGFEIKVQQRVSVAEVQVHMPSELGRKKHKKSLLNKLSPVKDPRKHKSKSSIERLSPRAVIDDEESSIGLPSRSDALTWDYYTEQPTFESLLPIDIDDDMQLQDSVCLPMATTFQEPIAPDVRKKSPSFSRKNELIGAKTKSRSKRQ